MRPHFYLSLTDGVNWVTGERVLVFVRARRRFFHLEVGRVAVGWFL